jgi:hypothetical protein
VRLLGAARRPNRELPRQQWHSVHDHKCDAGKLRERGYSDAEIADLTPQQAHDVLNSS